MTKVLPLFAAHNMGDNQDDVCKPWHRSIAARWKRMTMSFYLGVSGIRAYKKTKSSASPDQQDNANASTRPFFHEFLSGRLSEEEDL